MDENVAVSCPRTKEEEDLKNPADSDFRCHPAATVAAAEHAVVAFYAWRSEFIRDLFHEFPPPEEKEKAGPES